MIHSQPIPDPTQIVPPVYNPHIDWDSSGEQYVGQFETWSDSQFRAENARNKARERREENIRFARIEESQRFDKKLADEGRARDLRQIFDRTT